MSKRKWALAALLVVPVVAAVAQPSPMWAQLSRGPTARWRIGAIRYTDANAVAPEFDLLYNRIYPAPREIGHFLAVALEFPKTVMVDEVRFMAPETTAYGIGCTTRHDRIMHLFVGPPGLPEADPEMAATIVVPGNPNAAQGHNEVTVAVDPPVEVLDSEVLFVAIEMNGTHPNDLSCLSLAPDDGEPEDDYWSNTVSAPYAWAGLESTFSVYYEPIVSASGLYEY